MERHGLTCSARHRALGDAQVLRDFWCKLRRDVPEPALAAAAQSRAGRAQIAGASAAGLRRRPAGGARRLPVLRRGRRIAVRRQEQFAAHAGARQFAAGEAATPRTAGSRARCGASIGWRPPASSGPCCARPSGSRSQKPLVQPAPQELGAVLHIARGARRGPRSMRRRLVEAVPIDELDAAATRAVLSACFIPRRTPARRSATSHGRSSCASRCWGWRRAPVRASPSRSGKCRGACVGKEPLDAARYCGCSWLCRR